MFYVFYAPAYVILTTFVGGFGGLALVSILVYSQPILSLAILLHVILLLLLFLYAKKFSRNPKILSSAEKIIILNVFALCISILYVILVNLINLCRPSNPLLELETLSSTRLDYTALHTIMAFAITAYTLVHLAIISNWRAGRVFMRILSHSLTGRIITLLIILNIVLYIALCIVVETQYSKYIEELRKTSLTHPEHAGCAIDRVWGFVKYYSSNFTTTYMNPCPKPRQLLIVLPPLINNKDFVAKLAATSRTGACIDFALGVTKLIEDLFGYKTRITMFIGQDHTIPEVEINRTWHVIDALYTIPNYPVEANQYAEYLRENQPRIYNTIKRIIDFDTGQDLTNEHGFQK